MGAVVDRCQYGTSEPNTQDGRVFVIGMKELQGGYIKTENLSRVNVTDAELESLRLQKGDVLLNRTNSPELVGKAAIFSADISSVYASYLVRLSINSDEADSRFVNYWLNSYIAQVALKRISTRAISQANINPTEIRAHCPLPLPPLPEQRKIAEILRTWDDAIKKLEALRAAKHKRFDALAQRLLGPSRAVGRGVPVSNWLLTNFGEVFTERQERNDSLGASDVVTVGKYAIRKQSEHFKKSVASKDLSNYWIISPGDFVYDPMSAYYGALGRYEGVADGIVSPAYRVLQLKTNVLPLFMVHLLRSYHVRFLLETRSSQGNKEGKRRLLQREDFAAMEFKLPSVEVQKKIVEKLAVAEREVSLIGAKLECLNRQKRGLMQKLLTGEWRVKVEAPVA